jgi:maltose alpha-D-glucosyltransferase/alpha-amylase
MHLALGLGGDDSAFRPEPFNPFYQRSLYQSMRNLSAGAFETLRQSLGQLPADTRRNGKAVLALEDRILLWFGSALGPKIPAVRIRTHGDLHLGQVLFTGRDFIISDFEGEPMRSLEERRLKRCPLRDVAGMIRSFHYAAIAALHHRIERHLPSRPERVALEKWVQVWHRWNAGCYVRAYLETAGESVLLAPMSEPQIATLLNVYLMEKAIYELNYELAHRPDWVNIPIEGILALTADLGLRPRR